MSANATSNEVTETDLIKKFKKDVSPVIATPKTKYAVGQWVVLVEKSLENNFLFGGPVIEIRVSFNEHSGKITTSYLVNMRNNDLLCLESYVLSLPEYEKLLERLQRNQQKN